jgi:biotin operon repressor
VCARAPPLTLSNFPASAEGLYADIRKLVRAKAERNALAVLDTELSQREIREATGLTQMAVKRNVRTLVEYEFLVASGFSARGNKRGYRLSRDEALSLVDLSAIPSPETLAANLQNLQSGSSGSDWVNSGSDPLSRG